MGDTKPFLTGNMDSWKRHLGYEHTADDPEFRDLWRGRSQYKNNHQRDGARWWLGRVRRSLMMESYIFATLPFTFIEGDSLSLWLEPHFGAFKSSLPFLKRMYPSIPMRPA